MGRGKPLFVSVLLRISIAAAAAFTLSSVPALAFRADIYSEQSYLGREQAIVNQLRVRGSQPLSDSVWPYVQAGQELMTSGYGNLSLDPGSSYAYAGPGVRVKLGPLLLFGETRLRAFYRPRPNPKNTQETVDVRALAVYGDFFGRRLGEGSRFAVFLEPYVEALYTSADFNNVIVSAFVRGGLRWQPSPSFLVDAYLEPYVAVDHVRHYYNNRADLKPSVRVQYLTERFQVAVLGSYIFNEYFGRGDFDANPYKDRGSGVRVLAVIGGSF